MPSQASPLTSTVVRLTADIRSAAPPGTALANATDLRIDAFTAQGQWNPEDNGGTVHIERLALDALRARLQATDLRVSRGTPPGATPAANNPAVAVSGQGLVQLTLPGSQLRMQGNIAPRTGQGEGRWSLTDADQTLRWLGRLPWLGRDLQGTLRTASAKGQAQLQLQWKGGWSTLQQQLHTTAQGLPPSADAKTPPFQIQTSLTSPQLDLVLPPQASGTADATNVATSVQLRALKAELNGQLTQATLRLEGQARTGTQRLSLQTQATGGLSGANCAHSGKTRAALGCGRLNSRSPGPCRCALAPALAPPWRRLRGPHPQQALRPPANPRGSPCKPAPGRRKSPVPSRAPWHCAGSPCG
jgi:translocation and assembly module TamB